MRKYLGLALILCLLAACGRQPSPTPDLVATQIAVEIAAHATMTAMVPTATDAPEPTATPTATEPPTPTTVPSSTPTPGPTVTAPPSIEAEEYAVYSALLQQNPINFDLGPLIVVREQTTVSDADMFERTLEQAPALPEELADSYRSRTAASYSLGPGLDPSLNYVLMPEGEYGPLLRKGGAEWTKFQARYPESRGLVAFSRVGFSVSGNEALALMGVVCGDLCASGGLYLLAKEEDGWKVQEALMEWIS